MTKKEAGELYLKMFPFEWPKLDAILENNVGINYPINKWL